MCGNDWTADDIGWGILLHRGEVSQSYLWRSGQVRGYSITIVTARHVAEPTEHLSARARTNRATLGDAMSDAGLINYGTEWWHWSFGDRTGRCKPSGRPPCTDLSNCPDTDQSAFHERGAICGNHPD